MKQREYTELQKAILKVLDEVQKTFNFNESGKKTLYEIGEKYGVKQDIGMTLREFIMQHVSFDTFYFNLNGKDISVRYLQDFLTDELCFLYPLTKEFIVVDYRKEKDETNSMCDIYNYYLTLEPKED